MVHKHFAEEFAIYMNYVRKLGFEETPDYEFLRELFTKVLKTLGEPEDGVFDWMLLNSGKGWEASNACFLFMLALLHTNHISCRHRPPFLPKPTQTHPPRTLHIASANIDGTEIMLHIDVSPGNCKTISHRQPLLFSALHRPMSRAPAVGLRRRSVGYQVEAKLVCSRLPLQADGPANSKGS